MNRRDALQQVAASRDVLAVLPKEAISHAETAMELKDFERGLVYWDELSYLSNVLCPYVKYLEYLEGLDG
jgi:hypothetical protein